MSAPAYDPTGVEYHTIPTLKLTSGTIVDEVRVAYRSYNATSTAGTVLIPTCFAGKINTTYTFNATPDSALSQYHVVVVAMLGNGESSSSSNNAQFPAPGRVRYEDQIQAQHHLLTKGLHINHLEAVVGFSMGGQQAYHWAVMYPTFVSRIVSICSSARISGHNYAFLEGPIAAMTNSIDYIAWQQIKERLAKGEDLGPNLKEVKPKRGLAAWGRTYAAWLTSAEWFRERNYAITVGQIQGCASVEDWLKVREAGYAEWDADDLLTKARMWQMADIGKTHAGKTTKLNYPTPTDEDDKAFAEALGSITAKVLLMPCRTDQYFRPEASEEEMKHLKRGTLAVIESCWGHMSGGGANPDDAKFMDEKIAEHMKR